MSRGHRVEKIESELVQISLYGGVYIFFCDPVFPAVSYDLFYIVFEIEYPVLAFPVEIARLIYEISQSGSVYILSGCRKAFFGKGRELRSVQLIKKIYLVLFFQLFYEAAALIRLYA